MRRFRFVHTADWHLGQPYANVPTLADRLRDARLEAVERLLDAALNWGADAVLAAGDQFDSPTPDPEWVERLLASVASRPALPVYLIPGNHDPARPGSVYSNGAFRGRPDNLIVLDRPEPFALERHHVTIYPCPCTARWGPDPMTWIPPRAPDHGLRVALAHGSLPTVASLDDRNYPINADAPARNDLDYVALGDWHRPIPEPGRNASARMYYSGAPECGGWDEPEAGYALAVELEPGKPPLVTAIRTGRHVWRTIEADLADEADVAALLDRLEREADPHALVRLRLTGRLEPEPRERLDHGLESLEPLYAHFEADLRGVACRVGDPRLLSSDPRARRVLETLGRLMMEPGAGAPALPAGLPPLDADIAIRAWNLARRHLE
jgi:DNA repair exonuclease SbcCD nuclease subunit